MELMKASEIALGLIKRFEGLKLEAYKPLPSEKYYTIGWGHYGADVKMGMSITQKQAEEFLKGDIKPVERLLNGMGINYTQNQFDALVDFIYNLGEGNFKKSTMYKNIVARKSDVEITDQMVKWVNAGGRPLLGLKKRRVAEANMFLGKTAYRVDNLGNIKKV